MDKISAETSKCYNVTGYYRGFYSRKSFECTAVNFFQALYRDGIVSRMKRGPERPMENIQWSDYMEVCMPGCQG